MSTTALKFDIKAPSNGEKVDKLTGVVTSGVDGVLVSLKLQMDDNRKIFVFRRPITFPYFQQGVSVPLTISTTPDVGLRATPSRIVLGQQFTFIVVDSVKFASANGKQFEVSVF